jgi:hypothetical protein
MKNEIDLSVARLEWSEEQQHWDIDHRPSITDSSWGVIVESFDTDLIGAFCDWVDEHKAFRHTDKQKMVSFKQMQLYFEDFIQIYNAIELRKEASENSLY